jgi:hypothetical protein
MSELARLTRWMDKEEYKNQYISNTHYAVAGTHVMVPDTCPA